MNLQRQRLAESQVLDRQTRRVLHDEVLPQLHTTLLLLSSDTVKVNSTHSEAIQLLADAHRQISDLLREIPKTTLPTLTRLGLIGALQRVVSEELAGAFDDVTWQVTPEAEQITRNLLPLTAEVLFYATREAIRNAWRHGRAGDSQQPLHLRLVISTQAGLTIYIEDDGVGLEATKNSNGGSGQGLALHSTMLAIVGGTLDIKSLPGSYTRVTLKLPQAALDALGQ
jgi:signal transduction histidine kinase